MTKLSDKEKLFWADLLLYYEQEVNPNPKGFNIRNKELSEFIKTNSIELNTTNKEELTGLKEETRKNVFRFTCSGNACANFLRHLRNAFAHGRIEKDEKGDYKLSDKNGTSLTMIGYIKPKLLVELVEKMKSTRSS